MTKLNSTHRLENILASLDALSEDLVRFQRQTHSPLAAAWAARINHDLTPQRHSLITLIGASRNDVSCKKPIRKLK